MKTEEVPSALDIRISNQNQSNIDNTSSYIQWTVGDNNKFYPSFKTISMLPSGVYSIRFDTSHNRPTWIKQDLNIDDLYILGSNEYSEIINDLKVFWSRTSIFKHFGFVHKRGILLHGKPGCGKSGLIQLICMTIIQEYNGIIFNITDDEDLEYYTLYISDYRKIEPLRPIVVIMEDIDEIAGDSKYAISNILNLLDGIKQIQNVVYIATTNYPEKLEDRIANRPSRFDRKYEIKLPNKLIRRQFFEFKFKKYSGTISNSIEEWVNDSEGFSLAHCKEMIISVLLLGNSYEYTLEQLGVLKNSGKKKVSGFTK